MSQARIAGVTITGATLLAAGAASGAAKAGPAQAFQLLLSASGGPAGSVTEPASQPLVASPAMMSPGVQVAEVDGEAAQVEIEATVKGAVSSADSADFKAMVPTLVSAPASAHEKAAGAKTSAAEKKMDKASPEPEAAVVVTGSPAVEPVIVAAAPPVLPPALSTTEAVIQGAKSVTAPVTAVAKGGKQVVAAAKAGTESKAPVPVATTPAAGAEPEKVTSVVAVSAATVSEPHTQAQVVLTPAEVAIAPVAHVVSAILVADQTPGSTKTVEAHPVAQQEAGPSALDFTQGAVTISASPQVLEVGMASGTHGWLRLRAEMGSSGQVTASVIASSASAAQELHRELPALNDYLSREQVGIASVNVSAASATSAGASTGMAADAGGGQGAGDQPGQQQTTSVSAGEQPFDFGAMADVASVPSLYSQGGGWVNVRV